MSGPIDPTVAERVLARALANGGRFAEVFAERRQGQSLAIDESRIESVQAGTEEGAGVRVVEGNTTYFAHVDGLEPAEIERADDPPHPAPSSPLIARFARRPIAVPAAACNPSAGPV